MVWENPRAPDAVMPASTIPSDFPAFHCPLAIGIPYSYREAIATQGFSYVCRVKHETQEQVRKHIREYFRQLNTLFGAFLAGIILFLFSVVIAVYYQGPMDPTYASILLFAAPLSGMALLLMGYRLFRGRLLNAREGEKLHQKMDGYRSAMVIRMILLDGAAFIQLVAYVMTDNKLFIAFALVIATSFMLYKPGIERFINDLELNDVEAKVMRDHHS